MNALHLSDRFALQSIPNVLRLSQIVAHRDGLAALIEADRYPIAGDVRIDYLRPGRAYCLSGAGDGWCRADPDGRAMVPVSVSGPTILLLAPAV